MGKHTRTLSELKSWKTYSSLFSARLAMDFTGQILRSDVYDDAFLISGSLHFVSSEVPGGSANP